MTTTPKIIIALVGLKFSGKGTLAAYLAKHFGFTIFRTRDCILADAGDYGIVKPREEVSIPEMQFIGNAGREKGGNGYWALRQYEKACAQGVERFLMDGVRHPDEIKVLREVAVRTPGTIFVAIGIEASFMNRFARLAGRNDEGDAKLRDADFRLAVAKFSAMDDRDRGIGEPWHGQQVDATLSVVRHMAQQMNPRQPGGMGRVYGNNGTLDDYHEWISTQMGHVEAFSEFERQMARTMD
jgi:dephospho-CoA kinase